MKFLRRTSTVIYVSDALDLHIYELKSNPISKKKKELWKQEFWFLLILAASNLKHSLLQRGGGGPEVYIIALIDSSISFSQKVSGLEKFKEFRT